MEYTCSFCGETYETREDDEWNSEKADEEAREVFGVEDISDFMIVCDDCYEAMNKRVPMREWAVANHLQEGK